MDDKLINIKLEDLGYDGFFDMQWKTIDIENSLVARVIAEHREAYRVKSVQGEYLAKITGKQKFCANKREDYPAVGDWVVVTLVDKEKALIHNILSRKTILKKKYSNKQDIQIIATNIDIVFVVESLDRDFNLNRLERYFVLANEGRIRPVVILNKIDLVSKDDLDDKVDQIKKRFENVDIILTSTITESGLDQLSGDIMKGKTYCFLGSSGVGKSSLVNKLLGKNDIKTGEISSSSGRGKHVTTTRGMYFLKNGGIVIDNPGTREVGVGGVESGIENVFEEITGLSVKCKYSDCTHLHEQGCAVLEAVQDLVLDEGKYQNYVKLKKENDYFEMSNVEKREKDRKFGKHIKKTLAQLEKTKNGRGMMVYKK